MKIKVSKNQLLSHIENVRKAISSKTALPILANILIEAENNIIKLTATDLNMTISSFFNSEIEESGSITIPAEKFNAIIRELPDKDIFIKTKNNNLMTIEYDRHLLKLKCLAKDEFPKTQEFDIKTQIEINQKDLKEMLKMTNFAMSTEETKYVLNGSLFAFKDNLLTVVATDGRRLSFYKKQINEKVSEQKIIVASKTINELIKILDEKEKVKITFNDNQIKFEFKDLVIYSRLIEGSFPDYEAVIPAEIKDKLIIDRDIFLSSIKRVSLLTTQNSQSIKLEVSKDKVIVSKQNSEIGDITEDLEAVYNAQDIIIGFNPNYLIDCLSSIEKDQIEIELSETNKPAIIRIEDYYIYLVLPMQIT